MVYSYGVNFFFHTEDDIQMLNENQNIKMFWGLF